MGESIELVDIGNFCEDCVIGFLGGLVWLHLLDLMKSMLLLVTVIDKGHGTSNTSQVSSALGIFPKEYRSRMFSGEDPQH